MTLQRRLMGLERDLAAIQAKIDSLESDSARISELFPEEKDRIQTGLDSIRGSWGELTQLLKEKDAKLEEAGDLHRFLRDLDHFGAWLTKTQKEIASEDTPSSLHEAEKLLQQHAAIQDEIENYADDYDRTMAYGEKITQEASPEQQQDAQWMFLRERLRALRHGWEELQQMWDNRQALLTQSLNLEMFLTNAKQAEVLLSQQEHVLAKEELPSNLEKAESLIKMHEAFLTTMEANDEKINTVIQFAHRLCDEGHFASDKIGKKADSIAERRNANREKALGLMERLRDLLQQHQFLQDCEELDEWIVEKTIVAQDESYRSAKTIHSKWTRHQAFEAEIASNKDRLLRVQEAGEQLVRDKPELAERILPRIAEVAQRFEELEDTTKEKGERLFDANRQALYEQTCDDIDGWMTDLEKQIETDTGSDLVSVNILMQKQQVRDFVCQACLRQVQIDKLYAGLKDLANERLARLMEALQLYTLHRDVDDLEQWIAEREVVAGSHELGQDYEHVSMLRDRFASFAEETEDTGKERINGVNKIADELIGAGHSDAAVIAEWKDSLNEAWADLRELIETRKQYLAASWELHKFFHDCKDTLGRIIEKQNSMSDELGRDAGSVSALHRKHLNYTQDLSTLQAQVQQLQEDSANLRAGYAGEKAMEITNREAEVVNGWRSLQTMCEARKLKLLDTGDLFKFFNLVRALMLWMDDMIRQMNTSEKP
ncbi:unnamed protein product, partial [Notodromas monacha]